MKFTCTCIPTWGAFSNNLFTRSPSSSMFSQGPHPGHTFSDQFQVSSIQSVERVNFQALNMAEYLHCNFWLVTRRIANTTQIKFRQSGRCKNVPIYNLKVILYSIKNCTSSHDQCQDPGQHTLPTIEIFDVDLLHWVL